MNKGFAFSLVFMVAMAACAQDRVHLRSGKKENCRVVRFEAGTFVCKLEDGRTTQVSAYNVKQIDFDAATEDPVTGEPPKALTGRFYMAVVETANIYVNGTLVHTGRANSFSEEKALSPGDLVVADVEHWQFQPYVKLAFMTSDRRFVVNFEAADFKELGVQPVADITQEMYDQARSRVKKVKEANQTPLLPQSIKDNSDAVWGTGKHCLLAARVTKDMITPIP